MERSTRPLGPLLSVTDGVIDLQRLEVRRSGIVERLTAKEAALVRYLAEQKGQIVSKQSLLRDVWGYRPGVRSRTVETTVGRVRAKIEMDSSRPRHLLTVVGAGYRLEHLGSGLLGRDALLDQLRNAAVGTWLTLHGPGGVGKTALARELCDAWPSETCWVALHHVHDVSGALVAVARALGVDEDEDVASRIASALGARDEMMLVVDNADHVGPALASVFDRWCDEGVVHLVVTRRQELEGQHEQGVRVPPLDPPSATALLFRRAEAAGAPVQADDPGLHALADALQGLPLALEVVAPRLVFLTPQQATDRVRRDLLALDGADQRLQRSFEVSWELLKEAERSALVRLCILSSAATVPHVEALLEGLPAPLDHLDQLRRKALVEVRHESGVARVFLLDAVRALGRERATDPDLRSAEVGHLDFVEKHGAQLAARAFEDPAALDRLEQLEHHIESAMAMTTSLPRQLSLLRIWDPLLTVRRPTALCEQHWHRMMQHADELDVPLRIEAHLGWVRSLFLRDPKGPAAARAALALAHAGTTKQRIEASIELAHRICFGENDPELGEQMLMGVIDETRLFPALHTRSLDMLANIRVFRDPQALDALDASREAVAWARARSHTYGLTRALWPLQRALQAHGELSAALHALSEIETLLRRFGHTRGVARAQSGMAICHYDMGDLAQTRTYLQQSARTFARVGDRRGMVAQLANLAVLEPDPAIAESLFREARAKAQSAGEPAIDARLTLNIGVSLHLQERPLEALPYYDEAAEKMDALGQRLLHALVRSLRAGCLADLGRSAEARRELSQTEAYCSDEAKLDALLEVTRAHVQLGSSGVLSEGLRDVSAKASKSQSGDVRLALRLLKLAIARRQAERDST
ncbi:MAG: winged helix-turn-helix domain-containing protein [Myxococcota bacterium]